MSSADLLDERLSQNAFKENKKAKRNRNLLQYYGVQTTPTTTSTPAPTSTLPSSSQPATHKKGPSNKLKGNTHVERKPDPLHLDNPAFSSELYLNKYLYELSISDLIRKDNDLVTEIKELDGDMKTLVYENYSKFISATDMIRRMKTNVENMEMEVEKLYSTMERVTQTSESISDSFAEKRAKIHQLSGVYTLLQKLSFVFELPAKLQMCYKHKNYFKAVKYYSQTHPLLKHYGHLTMFKKITEESRAIMTLVAKQVNEKLDKEQTGIKEITECIGMLIGLGDQEGLQLVKLHLTKAQVGFQKIIQKSILHLKNMKQVAQDPALSDLPSDMQLVVHKVTHLNKSVLLELSEMVASFDAYFLNMGITTFSPTNKVNIASPDPTSKMHSFTMKLDPKDDLSKLPALAYIHVLKCIQKDVSVLDPLKEHANIDVRVANMTHEWIARIVDAVFDKALMEFMNKFKELENLNAEQLEMMLKGSSSWLEDHLIRDCLPIFENFVKADTSPSGKGSSIHQGLEEMTTQIQTGFEQFWYRMFDKMMDLTTRKRSIKNENKPKSPPLLALCLSKITHDLSKSVIESVYSVYTERVLNSHSIPTKSIESPTKKQQPRPLKDAKLNSGPQIVTAGGGTYGYTGRSGARSNPSLNNLREQVDTTYTSKSRELSALAKQYNLRLLRRFVSSVASDFSVDIRHYFRCAKWLGMGQVDPENVSECWIEYIKKLGAFEDRVKRLYENGADSKKHRKDKSAVASKKAPTQKPTTTPKLDPMKSPTGTQFDALLSNIDKLFAERVEYFGDVEPERGSIMQSIAKVVFKCFIEEARQLTVDVAGFKQVQLDIEFLKYHTWIYAKDEDFMNSLLEEALLSCYKRCFEPQALDPNVHQRIIYELDRTLPS